MQPFGTVVGTLIPATGDFAWPLKRNPGYLALLADYFIRTANLEKRKKKLEQIFIE